MQATEVWECDHLTELGWLSGSGFWALIVQRKVRSRGVVVNKVGFEQSFEVAFIQHDDVV